MAKHLDPLSRVGHLPEPHGALLKQEGILLLEVGIPGSVTYRKFRAPGKSFSWRRQRYKASIALSSLRLMALRSTAVIIDVPFSDKRIKQMNFSVDGSDTLVVAFDAALFRDDWTGAIDYRSHTRQASNFLKMLGERVV